MGKLDNQVEAEQSSVQEEVAEDKQEVIKLTVKEAADVIEESSTTVRNWLRELKPYIPIQKAENGYNLFDEESLNALRQIKKLHREQGYSINQVKTYFDSGGELFKPINTEEQLQKDVKELKEQMKKQQDFNKALVEKLEKQQHYIDQRLNERDKLLLESMKQTIEAKIETAATTEKKKGFFSKLFKK